MLQRENHGGALFEMLCQEEPDWVAVLGASTDVTQANFVDTETNFTPLHLAVKSRTHATVDLGRIESIRALLESSPDAVYERCITKQYSPLMYLCCTTEMAQLEQDIQVLRLFAEHEPECFDEFGKEAVQLHTQAVSRLMQDTSSVKPLHASKPASFLKVLLAYLPPTISFSEITECMWSCNASHVVKLLACEEERFWKKRCLPKPSTGHSSDHLITQKKLSESWIWEFLHTILRAAHQRRFPKVKPIPPFNALHTAVSIPDFPVPFLMLLLRAYPKQLEIPSVADGNLPLHSVASWNEAECSASRKSMAVTQILSQDIGASSHRNKQGKTPLQLASESQTSSSPAAHDNGTRRLLSIQKNRDAVDQNASSEYHSVRLSI